MILERARCLGSLPPHELASRIAAGPDPLLFFDAGRSERAARWSIVLALPTDELFWRPEAPGPIDPARWARAAWAPRPRVPAALPMAGGVAGLLAFECAWELDAPRTPRPKVGHPIAWLAEFPAALCFDHDERTWWIGARPGAERHARALTEYARRALGHTPPEPAPRAQRSARPCWAGGRRRYIENVRSIQRAIRRQGELFEVSYAERFEADWSAHPWALYDAMRAGSSGDHFCYAQTEHFVVASASPERFLRVRDNQVLAEPIKGTRPRSEDARRDRAALAELLADEKERAENIMIVDLMRSDITPYCEPGSVRASEVCAPESFAGLHHLVSRVRGRLTPERTALDLLLGCFPAGSISGAPKLRSIERIAQLESTPRGFYTGSAFYWGDDGDLDASVLIRTATIRGGRARYGAGGAITARSDPRAEWDEALAKLGPLERALGRPLELERER